MLVPQKLRRHFYRNRMLYKVFGFLGLASFLTGWLQFSWYSIPATAAIFGFCYYIGTGGWKFLRIVYLTIGRDLRGLKTLIKLKWLLRRHQAEKQSIASLFEKTVAKHPNKIAMTDAETGSSLTFRAADLLANKIGNYFSSAQYQKDDVIAIFMESSPEYVCYWLGLSKIGVISALINFNLRGESLAHCINVSTAKTVIYSGKLADAVAGVKDLLEADIKLLCVGGSDPTELNSVNLENLVEQSPNSCPCPPKNKEFSDKLFYVYTSGTTGLPKAAIIRHSRFFHMAFGIGDLFNITSLDVNYIPLPLYHSNGGIVGIGQTILRGTTAIIKKRFSASKFFQDCHKYDATMTYYIGETCRYLLAQPQKPDDTRHRLRIAIGNGLRPQIWDAFKHRFNIKQIGEFYGSTEGNANVVNFVNRTAAVGFTSVIMPSMLPLQLVKVDEETGDLMRGADGLAIKCKTNEPGQMVGKIIKDDPFRQFDGYLNSLATTKKIAHDIFRNGDAAFLTGDVLIQDELGFLYFHDRTGDTFRWKGENVSTAEVESVISKIVDLRDVVVYGVDVPGNEGKAGMAAIADPDDHVDLNDLLDHLKTSLPGYSKPIFIRKLKEEAVTTGTFKYQKNILKKEGYCPKSVGEDSIFFFDAASAKYMKLDESAYQRIIDCDVRF